MNIQNLDDFKQASGTIRYAFCKENGYDNPRLAGYFRCSTSLISQALHKYPPAKKKMKQIESSKLILKLIARSNEKSKAA